MESFREERDVIFRPMVKARIGGRRNSSVRRSCRVTTTEVANAAQMAKQK